MNEVKQKWITLRYGFINFCGANKKVLKLQFKVDSNSFLTELVAIQHDNKLYHTTIHDTKGPNKASRMHHQLDNPEIWCSRDRDKYPEIVYSPLPDWTNLQFPFWVVTVPIHWGADRAGQNLYREMKTKEIKDNKNRIVDLSDCESDREFLGNLSVHLLLAAPETHSKFEAWTSKVAHEKRVTDIYTDSIPWIGASMTLDRHKGLFSNNEQDASLY